MMPSNFPRLRNGNPTRIFLKVLETRHPGRGVVRQLLQDAITSYAALTGRRPIYASSELHVKVRPDAASASSSFSRSRVTAESKWPDTQHHGALFWNRCHRKFPSACRLGVRGAMPCHAKRMCCATVRQRVSAVQCSIHVMRRPAFTYWLERPGKTCFSIRKFNHIPPASSGIKDIP